VQMLTVWVLLPVLTTTVDPRAESGICHGWKLLG